MLDDDEFDRWDRAAREALRGAELQAAGGLFHWAAFLSEQAAQLAVKGLLHGIGQGPRAWGHDVVRLGDAAADALDEALPRPATEALQRLARHYIPARYPDAVPGLAPSAYYGANDAAAAQSDAATVLDAVGSWWSELLAARGQPPGRPAEGPEDDSS